MAGTGFVQAADRWQRRLRTARIEVAMINTGTAVLIGATGIIAVVCLVAEGRGWMNPGTWAIVLAGGGVVTLCKAFFDFRDRTNEAALWRSILIREFGDDMRNDGEAARLARLAIEFRVRLATAEANATPTHAQKVTALLPRVDDWLDLIVGLARKVASLRGEARFQAGLATRAKERIAQIEAKSRAAADPAQARRFAETARALSAQVNAFDSFNRYVDDGCLRLEHAVGAFTVACSELVLELSRGGEVQLPEGTAVQINCELASTKEVLTAIGQLVVPDLPEVADDLATSKSSNLP